jgi:hypothetical protein
MALSIAPQASLADRVAPTLDLAAVRVEVTWIADSAELAEIRKQYETPVQRSRARSGIGDVYRRADLTDGVKGFSVLGKRNGEYVCLIFVERPAVVNDTRTLRLAHELLHCIWGAYHP